MLYHDFMIQLSDMNETRAEILVYLSILYEIDVACHFLKDVFAKYDDHFKNAMTSNDCINPNRRTFTRLYNNLSDPKMLQDHFEYLLTWLELRSMQLPVMTDHINLLALIQRTRLGLFAMLERECEQALFLMKLARIERKKAKMDIFKANDLFKKAYEFRSKIIDFEYEYTKFLVRKQNAHDAVNWLKG